LTIGVDYSSDDAEKRKEERKRLDKLVEYLKAGKGDCTVTEEIQTERWIKVIWYVPLSVQCVLVFFTSFLISPIPSYLGISHHSENVLPPGAVLSFLPTYVFDSSLPLVEHCPTSPYPYPYHTVVFGLLITRARLRGNQALPIGSFALCTHSLTIRNCCWNSITTVTRVKTNRFFESSPQALPLCYTVMEEVVAVARAKGMTVPEDTVEKLIKQCTDVKTGLPSSMMADNFAGRPMEVEVILGTPVKEAERLGVKVPTLLT
jgi:hypothetical protein